MGKAELAKAYDLDAQRRVNAAPAEWKRFERKLFLDRLKRENKRTLLEIGAGTGTDSLYFQSGGMEVACIDLSPEMIRYCREKGLKAQAMDFYELDFAAHSFDAVYALNCLLHVPKHEIVSVLTGIKRVLKRDGLFYMGLYGGQDSEGIWEDDACEPKRFFASYTDGAVRALVAPFFEELAFKAIPLPGGSLHFQSLLLRNGSTT